MRRSVFYSLLAALVLLPVLGVLVVKSVANGGNHRPSAGGPPSGPYRGSQPPRSIQIPNFSLASYRGGIVRTRSLRGKVVVLTFLDTKCRTKCPIVASQLSDGMRLLTASERREVAAFALTVDPPADTPQTVRAFLRQRHALGTFDYLLGTIPEMRPIWHAFFVVAATQTGSADVHSTDVRIFDRRGIWVSTLHVPPDLTPENLAHDIRVGLREGDRS